MTDIDRSEQDELLHQLRTLGKASRRRAPLLVLAVVAVLAGLIILTVQATREADAARKARDIAVQERDQNIASQQEVAAKFARAQAAFQAKDSALLATILADGRIDAVTQAQSLQDAPVLTPDAAPTATPGPSAPVNVATAPAVAQGRKVFFQFAGSVQRADVIVLIQALRGAGWNVIGTSGEDVNRIRGADKLQQVRYHDAADLPAAKALADALTATRPGKPAIKPVPYTGIYAGTLEVWIS